MLHIFKDANPSIRVTKALIMSTTRSIRICPTTDQSVNNDTTGSCTMLSSVLAIPSIPRNGFVARQRLNNNFRFKNTNVTTRLRETKRRQNRNHNRVIFPVSLGNILLFIRDLRRSRLYGYVHSRRTIFGNFTRNLFHTYLSRNFLSSFQYGVLKSSRRTISITGSSVTVISNRLASLGKTTPLRRMNASKKVLYPYAKTRGERVLLSSLKNVTNMTIRGNTGYATNLTTNNRRLTPRDAIIYTNDSMSLIKLRIVRHLDRVTRKLFNKMLGRVIFRGNTNMTDRLRTLILFLSKRSMKYNERLYDRQTSKDKRRLILVTRLVRGVARGKNVRLLFRRNRRFVIIFPRYRKRSLLYHF